MLSLSLPALLIALQEDRWLHRHLFHLSAAWVAAVVVLLAARGVFFYLSPTLPCILGWSAEEFKRHYTTYLTGHPVNREVVAKTEGSLAGVQQEPYPVEVRHKDGSTRWLVVYEVPIKDAAGRVASVLGIARLDGTIRFANKSWAKLHGYAPEEPVVACTGFLTPGLEKDLLKKGFTALLPKPYTGRTLSRLMAGVLAERG